MQKFAVLEPKTVEMDSIHCEETHYGCHYVPNQYWGILTLKQDSSETLSIKSLLQVSFIRLLCLWSVLSPSLHPCIYDQQCHGKVSTRIIKNPQDGMCMLWWIDLPKFWQQSDQSVRSIATVWADTSSQNHILTVAGYLLICWSFALGSFFALLGDFYFE